MHEPRGHTPFYTSSEQDAVLAEMYARATRVGEAGVAIFDLDGCVFDNRHRQVRILRELASQTGWHELYRVEVHHFRNWDLRDTLERAGLSEAFLAERYKVIRGHWFRCFFRGDYCAFDHAMPGAPELVRHCAKAGMGIVYLTARHEEMREGTMAALRAYGFPTGLPRTALFLKPTFYGDDTDYKVQTVAHAGTWGTPSILLDNEPSNANSYLRLFPDALTVFVETDHSPDAEDVHPDLPRIRGYLRTDQV